MNPLEPTQKSKLIEDFLERTSGRTTSINLRKCIDPPLGCGRQIDPGEIECWDELTLREYTISGWCRDCQDKTFMEDDA